MATRGEPIRRLRDDSPVLKQTLHDGRLDRLSNLRDVDFRGGGRYGRFEWTATNRHATDDLYLQYFPPSLQTLESPPEFMLHQMARAGVDRAVLQNARPYGRLNTSTLLTALISTDYARVLDDPAFDSFWATVRDLEILVFWEVFGIPDPNNPDDLLSEIDRLNRWASRWPTMRGVEYPFAELRPTVQALVHRVGPSRLIWGSDMSNVERNCTYRQSLHYVRLLAQRLAFGGRSGPHPGLERSGVVDRLHGRTYRVGCGALTPVETGRYE